MSGRGLAPRSTARRIRRLLARAAAILIIVLVAGELALRGASLLVDTRATAWRPGAEVRILCVGDSHTYGIAVEDWESYPAQLQELLEARHAGRFSIINLGIPGLSSTQVRHRLAAHVARYEPDLVIVWCGSNNAWNRVEAKGAPSGASPPWSGIAYRSRFYRLVRVWLHDRELESWPTGTRADGTHQESEVDLRVPGREEWALRHGGIVERLRNDRAPARADHEMEQRARRDYAAMAVWLRAVGIPMVLVQYPLEVGPYALANRAMRRVAAEEGVALVDSPAVLLRVSPDERRWLRGRHPSSPIYGEIAEDLVPIVVALSGGAPTPAGMEGGTP
jgi:lysophospholipase L1-like esterase